MSRKEDELTPPSTPRLRNAATAFISKGGNYGPYDNIEVEYHGGIGSGKQGKVLSANLYCTVNEQEILFPCVAKNIFAGADKNGKPVIPKEMLDHLHITDSVNLPSIDSALLRIIGIYQDPGTKEFVALMPRCEKNLFECQKCLEEMYRTQPLLHAHIFFDLFSSMIDALTHLKDLNKAHGDIKPANIAFYRAPTTNPTLPPRIRPCLLDFGAVTQNEENPISTPLYQAPELVRSPHLTTSASDIWACGSVLCELMGENIVPKDGAGQDIKELYPLMFKKNKDFEKAKAQSTENNEAIEPEFYQTRLRQCIMQYSSFEEGMTHIRTAMRETLPERRPTVETLIVAREKLLSLKPSVTQRQQIQAYQYVLWELPTSLSAVNTSTTADTSSMTSGRTFGAR